MFDDHIAVVAAVIERDGRFLVTERLAGTHLAGLWEFPGGKREPGESPEDALVREIREELDVEIAVGERVALIRHRYPEKAVELDFYRATIVAGEPRAVGCAALRWVERGTLLALPMPEADRPLLAILAADR